MAYGSTTSNASSMGKSSAPKAAPLKGEVPIPAETNIPVPEDNPRLLGMGGGLDILGSYEIAEDKDNIIERTLYNIHYDTEDVMDLADDSVWELLPPPVELPIAPPVTCELYAVNWARVINYGGLTDASKDIEIDTIKQWSLSEWQIRHQWPAHYTLDPTYVYYTQDPGVFYTQNSISYYDEDGNAVPVDSQDIIWKLNGKEVHKGWHLSLGGLSRTVDVIPNPDDEDNPIVIIKPQILEVQFNNKAGMVSKQMKFVAIDSDDSYLLGNVPWESGAAENFSAQWGGSFKVVNDEPEMLPDGSLDQRVEFVEDPRYGARKIWVRFEWRDYGKGKNRKRDFKKNNAKFKVDGVEKWYGKAETVCGREKNRTDAKDWYPEIYNSNGKVRSKFRDGEAGLADLSTPVYDLTQGRDSALLYDEYADGNYKTYLFQFHKPPGPFTLEMKTSIKVRDGGKKRRKFHLDAAFVNGELDLDTAFDTATNKVQDIDLGVFNIGYTQEKW